MVNTSIDPNDKKKLEVYKGHYVSGNYNECLFGIKTLISKYINSVNDSNGDDDNELSKYNDFYVDLLFSYSNICSIFSIKNEHEEKLFYVIDNLEVIDISANLKEFCKIQIAFLCLQNKRYLHKSAYLSYINSIKGPNISSNNMRFFNKNDTNKTLLIYDGGGIGDKIMLGRLVFILMDRYITNENNNKLIFLVQDNIIWFMREILKDYNKIQFVSDKQLYLINKFDYHCNLLSLIKYLNLDYGCIRNTFVSYMDKLNIKTTDVCRTVMKNIKPNTYIFNWKGNPDSAHEKHNRMMNLINAIPLFKLTMMKLPINWLVVTKNITEQEKKILNKYKIKYVGDAIDNDNMAYYDTISILKHENIKGVVSTDTSLPHLSLSLGVKTFILLTTGCEWRWTKDETTNWYPDALLFRQIKNGDWSYPISQVVNRLQEINCNTYK